MANATPTVIGLSDGVSRYYRHEFGTDDGSAIQAFIQSGDFNIDEGGEQLMRIARFIPDFEIKQVMSALLLVLKTTLMVMW